MLLLMNPDAERHLFPPIEPYATGRLALDGLHEMYWEESGNPNGLPIVFVHGGPGGGAEPKHRRFFDPNTWRIVVFDQRGAGRSTPLAEIRDNTTQHLVGDMERLRDARGIECWAAFGGSWGSTLALAYAEAHPARCTGLIVRGIFLGERPEIEWFMTGMRFFSPEPWNGFADGSGEKNRIPVMNHSISGRSPRKMPRTMRPVQRAGCASA